MFRHPRAHVIVVSGPPHFAITSIAERVRVGAIFQSEVICNHRPHPASFQPGIGPSSLQTSNDPTHHWRKWGPTHPPQKPSNSYPLRSQSALNWRPSPPKPEKYTPSLDFGKHSKAVSLASSLHYTDNPAVKVHLLDATLNFIPPIIFRLISLLLRLLHSPRCHIGVRCAFCFLLSTKEQQDAT